MGTPALEIREAEEQRVVRFAQRPITFEEFLELTGKDDLELIDGVMVKRMARVNPSSRRMERLL